MAPCVICNCSTIKKYNFGDSYLCSTCKDLTIDDLCRNLQGVLDDILMDELTSDFDEQDILDFLETMIDEEEEEKCKENLKNETIS